MAKRQQLGEILVQKGLVRPEDINKALRIQVGGNRRLGYILINMGLLSDLQLLETLSQQLDIPIIRIDDEFSEPAKGVVPKYLCRKYSVIPLALEKNNVLKLAMVDPLDDQAIADIENFTGLVVQPVLASQKEISIAVRRHIPFSLRDVLNPQIYSRVAKIASAVAIILLLITGGIAYRYVQTERYGTVSIVGASKVYKNHDLMIGVEKDGKISLLGHGAYSSGYYSVTFESAEALKTFIEKKKNNVSTKQYNWMLWVIDKKLAGSLAPTRPAGENRSNS